MTRTHRSALATAVRAGAGAAFGTAVDAVVALVHWCIGAAAAAAVVLVAVRAAAACVPAASSVGASVLRPDAPAGSPGAGPLVDRLIFGLLRTEVLDRARLATHPRQRSAGGQHLTPQRPRGRRTVCSGILTERSSAIGCASGARREFLPQAQRRIASACTPCSGAALQFPGGKAEVPADVQAAAQRHEAACETSAIPSGRAVVA